MRLALAALLLGVAVLQACGDRRSTGLVITPVSDAGTPPRLAGALPGDLVAAMTRYVVLLRASGEQRELARMPGNRPVHAVGPAWSPDGATIAYVQRAFDNGSAANDWGDDVLAVPATGGTPRLLRKHAQRGEQVQGLTWLPGGDALLIGRGALLPGKGPSSGLRGDIIQLDVRSGREQLVAEGGFQPSLARDGKRLVYLRLRELQSELVVANADGSAPRVLVPAGTFASMLFPRISPDGTTVVFAAGALTTQSRDHRGGSPFAAALAWVSPARALAAGTHGLPMDIWSLDIATGERRVIAPLAEDDPMAVWSSDGRTLVVFATRGLYTVGVGGGAVVRVGDGVFDGQIDLR